MRRDRPVVTIVRLTQENAAGVARLWRRCFPNEALRAWCGSGVQMTAGILRQRTLLRPAFDPAGSFVALAGARVAGFCLAAKPSEERPDEGHLSALAVEPRLRRQGIGSLLLRHAERYLRRRGTRLVLTTFERNPLALLPGVPTGDAAHPFLLNRGYRSYERDLLLVMVQQTDRFRFPGAVRERIRRLESEGIRIGRMQPDERPALEQMLAEHFPSWHAGIASALDRGIPVIVAERRGRVLGFSGHFQVMKSGKGAFSALGVAPPERRHGLGSALFNTMCSELKAGGARFVVLTTGLANPAQELYLRAGFRTGCVVDYGMKKELGTG